VNSATEIGRFVEIHADLRFDTGLVAHDLSGADAAQCDLALAGSEIGDREARHHAAELGQAGRAGIADLFTARRRPPRSGTSCSACSRFLRRSR
jgi:hypothetical protein